MLINFHLIITCIIFLSVQANSFADDLYGTAKGWTPASNNSGPARLLSNNLNNEDYLNKLHEAVLTPWGNWSGKIDDINGLPISFIFQEINADRIKLLWEQMYNRGEAHPLPGHIWNQRRTVTKKEVEKFLFDRYNHNKDKKLTISELGEFGLELSAVSHRGGCTSKETILYMYLVMLRYIDVNGDGEIDDVERNIALKIETIIADSHGDPFVILPVDAPLKTTP